MAEARAWKLAKRFEGMPKLSDFELVKEKLPALEDGQILVKAEWLTVDPYMRGASNSLPLGSTMIGGQVARVIESRHPQFPVGSKIVGNLGWRDMTVVSPGTPAEQGPMSVYKLPNLRGLPESYALGVLGMPGNTAYFGFTKLCQPKAGDTLVVSAAAGAVGSIVGQIGKILGLKVIGYAGTDDKVQWLKKDLGFDHAFNYKTVDLYTSMKDTAKNGVDCYFDNVGAEFTYNVMRNMNAGGRIAVCGAISQYNNDPTKPQLVPFDYASLIYKNIKMEGFMVMRWAKEWLEGIHQLRDWIVEGKLKVQETVNEGFEIMPQAFIDLLSGKNTGKQIIKAL